LRPLVEECLDYDPAVRPTITAICEMIQVSKDVYMKESPQEVITLHQQVEQQKTENDELRRENEQQKFEISHLKFGNDQLKFKVDQLNQQLVSVIGFVIFTIYGIAILVLHKECTNTTSSQST